MSAVKQADVTPVHRGWDQRVLVAVSLSVTAGFAHLWGTSEHLAVWWGYGAFFVGVGLAQTFYGFLLLWSQHPLVHVAAIIGNVAVILTYVLTRTSGIPMGPHATVIEDAGVFDMVTTAMELGLVIVVVSMLPNSHRTRTINGLVVVGAVAWGLRLTGFLP
jgi:hypothetical protein